MTSALAVMSIFVRKCNLGDLGCAVAPEQIKKGNIWQQKPEA
jgi:hypothetical protein